MQAKRVQQRLATAAVSGLSPCGPEHHDRLHTLFHRTSGKRSHGKTCKYLPRAHLPVWNCMQSWIFFPSFTKDVTHFGLEGGLLGDLPEPLSCLGLRQGGLTGSFKLPFCMDHSRDASDSRPGLEQG